MVDPMFVPMYALKNIRPLTAEIEMGDSFCGGLEDIGFYCDRWFLFYQQAGTGTAYYEEAEMRNSAQVAFRRFSNQSHREEFSTLVSSVLTAIGEYIKRVAEEQIKTRKTDFLFSLLEQGWGLEARAFALYNATQPQNVSLVEAAIRSSLVSVSVSRVHAGEFLALLATPDHLSKIGHEELDLLELVFYIQEQRDKLGEHVDLEKTVEAWPDLKSRLLGHFKKYDTLMLGEGVWCPQIKDLYKNISAMLDIDPNLLLKRRDELRDYNVVTANNKSRLARELGLSEETLNLCKAAAFIGEARLLLRIDGWVPLIFAAVPIFQELARRKELTVAELMSQTKNELRSLFRERPLVEKGNLRARLESDAYLMMVRDRRLRLYYGDEARKVFASMVATEEHGEASAIKGMPAMKGKIVGRALVHGWGDDMEFALRQMTPDSILVAGQARPQLMPLVRRARGLVTDEGGIMGHAAVVARELGIPCIVGAKIATKHLRTGDLIELDATVGVVKILERRGD